MLLVLPAELYKNFISLEPTPRGRQLHTSAAHAQPNGRTMGESQTYAQLLKLSRCIYDGDDRARHPPAKAEGGIESSLLVSHSSSSLFLRLPPICSFIARAPINPRKEGWSPTALRIGPGSNSWRYTPSASKDAWTNGCFCFCFCIFIHIVSSYKAPARQLRCVAAPFQGERARLCGGVVSVMVVVVSKPTSIHLSMMLHPPTRSCLASITPATHLPYLPRGLGTHTSPSGPRPRTKGWADSRLLVGLRGGRKGRGRRRVS